MLLIENWNEVIFGVADATFSKDKTMIWIFGLKL
jgi:hypothetical protein